VRGLTVARGGRDVLHGLDFALVTGQITGLLGPSGCGKTTLIRALVGVQSGVRGEVTVLGSPAGSAELRRRVGYVTQAPAVYADLSVGENLRYFAAVAAARCGRVDEVLQLAHEMFGARGHRASNGAVLLRSGIDRAVRGGGPSMVGRGWWRSAADEQLFFLFIFFFSFFLFSRCHSRAVSV